MRSSLPERAVQPTRELGGITHKGASVAETGVNQTSLDRLNPPVHHIARCYAVCASARVVKGDLGDACDRRFGVNRTVGMEESTVTMRRVFAETHITGDVELGEERSNLLDGLDDRAFGVICGRSTFVLEFLSICNGENMEL